jgi:hypothetical protein
MHQRQLRDQEFEEALRVFAARRARPERGPVTESQSPNQKSCDSQGNNFLDSRFLETK